MNTGRTASNSGLYIQFQTAVLLQLPRPEELDDETLKRWINGQELLNTTLASALLPLKVESAEAMDKFILVKTFDIVVPADYQHETQLKSFKKKYSKSLYNFNNSLTDDNFSKVSAKLKPGQKVTVNVYRQTASGLTTSDERMTFLRALPGNKFYGAQAVSLVYEQQADQLEKGFFYVAMDEKDNLPLVDGRHGVPRWFRHSDGDYYFHLGGFENEWIADVLLFSFSDVSTEASA